MTDDDPSESPELVRRGAFVAEAVNAGAAAAREEVSDRRLPRLEVAESSSTLELTGLGSVLVLIRVLGAL